MSNFSNLPKNDPMNMFSNPKKYQGIMTEKEAKQKDKRKHEEADLHLSFCSWLKSEYPEKMFVRHEKERSRSHFLGNLMQKYNSLDGLPDFELLERSCASICNIECSTCDMDDDYYVDGFDYQGLYIEFKKPGEDWLEVRTGNVKKAYIHQYKCHVHLWSVGRCAYFCNDLEQAKIIFIKYITGVPLLQQIYNYYIEPVQDL
jgi:hypothetical protein